MIRSFKHNNPMHPGAFIKRVYLEPFDIGAKELADKLQISESMMSRIINGKGGLTPAMALKLSKVLGRSPESWLLMQDNHNLWAARQELDLSAFKALEFAQTPSFSQELRQKKAF